MTFLCIFSFSYFKMSIEPDNLYNMNIEHADDLIQNSFQEVSAALHRVFAFYSRRSGRLICAIVMYCRIKRDIS